MRSPSISKRQARMLGKLLLVDQWGKTWSREVGGTNSVLVAAIMNDSRLVDDMSIGI